MDAVLTLAAMLLALTCAPAEKQDLRHRSNFQHEARVQQEAFRQWAGNAVSEFLAADHDAAHRSEVDRVAKWLHGSMDGHWETVRALDGALGREVVARSLGRAFEAAAHVSVLSDMEIDDAERSRRARTLLTLLGAVIRTEAEAAATERIADLFTWRVGVVHGSRRADLGDVRGEVARGAVSRLRKMRRARAASADAVAREYDRLAAFLVDAVDVREADAAEVRTAEAAWRASLQWLTTPGFDGLADRYIGVIEAESRLVASIVSGYFDALTVADAGDRPAGMAATLAERWGALLLDERRFSGELLFSAAVLALHEDERIARDDELRFAAARLLVSSWARRRLDLEYLPEPEGEIRSVRMIRSPGVGVPGMHPDSVRDPEARENYRREYEKVRRDEERANALERARTTVGESRQSVLGQIRGLYRGRSGVDAERLRDMLIDSQIFDVEGVEDFVRSLALTSAGVPDAVRVDIRTVAGAAQAPGLEPAGPRVGDEQELDSATLVTLTAEPFLVGESAARFCLHGYAARVRLGVLASSGDPVLEPAARNAIEEVDRALGAVPLDVRARAIVLLGEDARLLPGLGREADGAIFRRTVAGVVLDLAAELVTEAPASRRTLQTRLVGQLGITPGTSPDSIEDEALRTRYVELLAELELNKLANYRHGRLRAARADLERDGARQLASLYADADEQEIDELFEMFDAREALRGGALEQNTARLLGRIPEE